MLDSRVTVLTDAALSAASHPNHKGAALAAITDGTAPSVDGDGAVHAYRTDTAAAAVATADHVLWSPLLRTLTACGREIVVHV